MKILSGSINRLPAKSSWTGTHTHMTPTQAAQFGISIIYQELSVINELSALENLFVGRIPVQERFWKGGSGFKNKASPAWKNLA